MKKTLTHFLIIISFNCLQYQAQINRVEYSYSIDDNFIGEDIINSEKDEGLKKNLILLNTSLRNYEKKLLFTLNFTRNESIYSMNKMLNLDFDKQLMFAIILTKGKDIIYSNIAKKVSLRKVKILGEEFNVKRSLDSIRWNLTQDVKQIGDYKCYKATTLSIFKQNSYIEAWYCPDLPYSFGPKGYGGLPGLILELKENNIIYYAKKIQLNMKENFTFKFEEKSKFLSQKELDSIISNKNKSRFRN
jgi:GLPGLI family protein